MAIFLKLMAGGIMAMMLVGDLCYGVCMATVPGVDELHGYIYVYWVSSNLAVSCGGVFMEMGDELCKYWNRVAEKAGEKAPTPPLEVVQVNPMNQEASLLVWR